MRLIHAASRTVEDFTDDKIPDYAILSHTWGQDEVSFHDMQRPDAVEKAGYAKIEQCCRQALQDGIRYVWVDTCCIDKTSSAELSEAINSMFRWYADAIYCYAFLADVDHENEAEEFDWSTIGASRWFSRGWTLQELVAPRHVLFYSRQWKLMGTKRDHAEQLSSITNIRTSYLHGGALTASIAEKMSWVAKRQTTREEDMAYCMLGLFDLSMSPRYGEGGRLAFRRLQEKIIKEDDDQSIFAWEADSLLKVAHFSCLAENPKAFARCGNMASPRRGDTRQPSNVTNAGIQISIPLREIDGRTYGILRCNLRNGAHDLAIPLQRLSRKTFARNLGPILAVRPQSAGGVRFENIYLTTKLTSSRNRLDRQKVTYFSEFRIASLPEGYEVFFHHPKHGTDWLEKDKVILCQGSRDEPLFVAMRQRDGLDESFFFKVDRRFIADELLHPRHIRYVRTFPPHEDRWVELLRDDPLVVERGWASIREGDRRVIVTARCCINYVELHVDIRSPRPLQSRVSDFLAFWMPELRMELHRLFQVYRLRTSYVKVYGILVLVMIAARCSVLVGSAVSFFYLMLTIPLAAHTTVRDSDIVPLWGIRGQVRIFIAWLTWIYSGANSPFVMIEL